MLIYDAAEFIHLCIPQVFLKKIILKGIRISGSNRYKHMQIIWNLCLLTMESLKTSALYNIVL